MSFTPLPETPPPAGSRCAAHVEAPAVSTCRRCGVFCCPSCTQLRAGYGFCSSCLEHPDIDYLETMRKRFWGKRDGWVWFFLVLWLPSTLSAVVSSLMMRNWLGALLQLVVIVPLVGYGLLRPWARMTLFLCALPALLVPFLPTFEGIYDPTPLGSALHRQLLWTSIAGGLVGILMISAAYASTRNRLAFRLPVSDAQLLQLYETRVANPLAARAVIYSLLSLLVPFSGPLALWLSWAALKKTRMTQWPPGAGARKAKVGVAISAFSTLLYYGGALLIVLLR
jgi:hypothetical protein